MNTSIWVLTNQLKKCIFANEQKQKVAVVIIIMSNKFKGQ